MSSHVVNSIAASIPGVHSRREFLRRSALLAGAGVATPWALNLAGLANAATDDSDDYRALVCLFMFGGNDHYNTFIPNDPAGHAAYLTARSNVARPLNEVVPIDPIGGFSGPGSIGFAPELPGMKRVFDAGDLAVVSNIGTLIRPIDKVGYANPLNRPPQLFSHNDQASIWQSSAPEGATTGWAGRMGDLFLDRNGSNSTFTSISVAGNAVMMSGNDALQFQVHRSGVTIPTAPGFNRDQVIDGIREVMALERPGIFPSSYSDVTRRSLGTSDSLSAAVDTAEDDFAFDSYFDVNAGIGSQRVTMTQLKMVAKLIAAGKNTLGVRRQVFFVSMGGFDHHSGLVNEHRPLIGALDTTLTAFYDAMKAMGLSDSVTTFTASDFGRSLANNGDGSDHGWGGHHVVLGGAVRGKRVYGTLPSMVEDGANDVGRGRLLPTTSVDQYASTFARWMGAGTSELEAVVPNIANFENKNLGFLDTPTTPPPTTGERINEPAQAFEKATRMSQES